MDQKAIGKTGATYNKSLCSMNCARMLMRGLKKKKSPDVSQGTTDGERQMHATDLNSIKSVNPCVESSAICKISLNSDNVVRNSGKTIEIFNNQDFEYVSHSNANKENINLKYKLSGSKPQEAPCFSIFTGNKNRSGSPDSPMKRSNKSTNLVKYKNILSEPTLKRPLSNCMLLTKYRLKVSKQIDKDKYRNRAVTCDLVTKVNNETQIEIKNKAHKEIQDEITISECDRITEQVMISLFETHFSSGKGDEVKYFINQIIRDLYEVKMNKNIHPLKALFRTLLEYWLKNTSVSQVKEAMTRTKSISKQSNRFFTKDEYLSSVVIDKVCKETQHHDLSGLMRELKYNKNNVKQIYKNNVKKRSPPKCQSPKRDTESFEKERRVQKLERLLKNTVYMCETGISESREKDIKITKALIDNLGKVSKVTDFNESNNNNRLDTSNSSTELPKIQDTINHLISETSLPPDVAKEFLNAYLGVLLHDSTSITNTSTQSSNIIEETGHPVCDVQTEKVTKRLSKSVITSRTNIDKNTSDKDSVTIDSTNRVDDGQKYLRDVLDKITTIFSKIKNSNNKLLNVPKDESKRVESKITRKDELGRTISEYPRKNFISHNYDENSVVIDLSKYDLENVSMFSDPAVKGMMSVTVQLKEKPSKIKISKRKHLSLKFSKDSKLPDYEKKNNRLSFIDPSDTSSIFNKISTDINKSLYTNYLTNDLIDLKPYLSSSEATSKAYRITHESDHSLDLSFRSSRSIRKEMLDSKRNAENEGTQPCFIMSTLKNNGLKNRVQIKKKVRLKECNGEVLNPSVNSPKLSFTGQTYDELTVFEEPKSKVIDEKFINLLLDNLSLLSKNMPSLNKDINNLYLKLEKNFKKLIQNDDNLLELSLIGKMYTKDSIKQVNDNQIQTEINLNPIAKACTKEAVSLGINTIIDFKTTIFVNRSANVQSIEKDKSTIGVQTEEIFKFNTFNYGMTNNIASGVIADQATTTNPDWLKHSEECAVNTVLRYVLNSNNSENIRSSQLEHDVLRKHKKYSPKFRNDMIKEIPLLSTQSQRPKSNAVTKDKDFQVYQLFLEYQYPVTRLSSLTALETKTASSSDLKTIYRCTSEPSYCSGPLFKISFK